MFIQLITIALVIFLALNTASGPISKDSSHKKNNSNFIFTIAYLLLSFNFYIS
ncbi:hypothetical protein [Mycoplasmopsis fermentans]|uniref:hypothetical protein n=1 Tax=Mycoplasmopsis fermentans TaxID=2115 RepID=UPI0013053AC0|nr:hypothetical protein [Mycoplasmopsis fermentans]